MDEIFKRGTCRHFKELTPVAKENLLTLVKAGTQVPPSSSSAKRKRSLFPKNGPLTAPPPRKTFSSKRNIWVSDQSGSRYIPMLTAKHIF